VVRGGRVGCGGWGGGEGVGGGESMWLLLCSNSDLKKIEYEL